jgi:hypothetical protein
LCGVGINIPPFVAFQMPFYFFNTFFTVASIGLKLYTVTIANISTFHIIHIGGAFITIMLIAITKPVFISEREASNLKGI